MIVNQRYVIQNKLGEGGMGFVYRAIDRLNGNREIALKQLRAAPVKNDIDTEEQENRLFMIAREFRALASLRHPNVISVLDYGFDKDGEPFFTMDLLDNPKTILEATEDSSLPEKVNYFLQLLEGLTYLHRRGIIHRDLKPDNVLINRDNVVKILDFGVAQGGVSRSMSQEEGATIAGTLAYMAPESFAENPATILSDLYSTGVIAYEIFARKHPIDASNGIAGIINAILFKAIDLKSLDASIAPIIGKLLSRAPQDRYPSAEAVIAALSETYDFVKPTENITARENILQNAPFIGRDDEFSQLKQALRTLVDIHLRVGSSWLLAGESGVGKSRLLNELRIQAVTRGVLVLNGQGMSEGGAVYELWRQPLRLLCLEYPPSSEEASILKPILPDIETLLGIPVADAPPALNPKIAQERLLATVERLFTQAKRPILLILEDIHWAAESLNILKRLNPFTTQHPIMIVASYRDDEAPALQAQLADMVTIKLHRLTRTEIGHLSQAMLGKVEQAEPLVDLLHRETDGNAFFIIEVMRALAESTGRLDMIGARTVPEYIIAGGMQQILERRLAQVPKEATAFLHTAAVAGRQLDLDLLSHLFADMDFERWLQQCVEALVIEVNDERWRFVHDKFRETILSGLPLEERQQLHRRVAQTMEKLYSGDAARAPLMLYHWQAADDAEQSLHYAELAGDQAMLNGANLQAKTYYETALHLCNELPADVTHQRLQVELCVKLSRVAAYHPEESLTDAMKNAVKLAETLNDEALLARILGSTGAYHFMLGQLSVSMQFFQQSMVLAEKLGLEELLLLPYNIIGRTVALAGNFGQSRIKLGDGIRLAEKFNDLELLSGSLAFYALSLMMQGLPVEAEAVIQRSLEVAEQVGPSRMTGTLVINGCGKMWGGHWEEALQFFNRSEALATKINDFLPLYWSRGFLGNIYMRTGNLPKAAEYLDKAIGMIEQGKTVFHLPLFHAYRAELDFLEGNASGALERTQASLEFGRQTQQELAIGEALATLGKIYSSQGEITQAETAFEQSLESHRQGGRFVQIATVYMELGKHRSANGDKRGAIEALDIAIEYFTRYKMTWYLQRARQIRATQ
ncbi:MAG: protein kinase [Anaerolineae bacterium]|nr:protein kinase [Anaerolineae bacterium]